VISTPAAFGGPSLRHAGKVEQIDPAAGFLVVDQLVRQGRHERRVIQIADDTPVVTAQRPRSWAPFEESELALFEVLVGDFVVVESAEHDGRLLARKITVVEPGRRPVQHGQSSRP
jgi:hypothetical protein